MPVATRILFKKMVIGNSMVIWIANYRKFKKFIELFFSNFFGNGHRFGVSPKYALLIFSLTGKYELILRMRFLFFGMAWLLKISFIEVPAVFGMWINKKFLLLETSMVYVCPSLKLIFPRLAIIIAKRLIIEIVLTVKNILP